MKELLYISNNGIARNGRVSPFLQQEKKWLLRIFGRFLIICDSGIYKCDANGNISLFYKGRLLHCIKCVVKTLIDINVYKELRHLINDKKFSLKNLVKIVKYAYDAASIYHYILHQNPSGKLLYSFWFSYDSYACAKIKESHPEIVAIARAHAYEVQINRNTCNPYLMKKYTCDHLDEIAFISQNSLLSFFEYYRDYQSNINIRYLGSTSEETGFVERKQTDRFIILSCSSIVHVKRLDRLINVISNWNALIPLHWIHIGDGMLAMEIKKTASELLDSNPLVTYEFLGHLDNNRVHDVLKQSSVNLFVNVSDSEGVPVSIMEAMSLGLPVVAPKIFGIPELVDDECGILYDAENPEHSLMNCLETFFTMSIDERNRMGRNAYNRWKKRFCLEDNLQCFFQQYIE